MLAVPVYRICDQDSITTTCRASTHRSDSNRPAPQHIIPKHGEIRLADSRYVPVHIVVEQRSKQICCDNRYSLSKRCPDGSDAAKTTIDGTKS